MKLKAIANVNIFQLVLSFHLFYLASPRRASVSPISQSIKLYFVSLRPPSVQVSTTQSDLQEEAWQAHIAAQM